MTAQAGAHLHSVGLSHGDLYAHNILVHPQSGDAKLADFGAAFYYGGADAPNASAYQVCTPAARRARHDCASPAFARQFPSAVVSCFTVG